MTFSIVGRSEDGESWGVAVASKFLAVGCAVPAAIAGVGALATQAEANVAWKGGGLGCSRTALSAEDAVERLVDEDEKPEHRQLGVVDARGGSASHTGAACLDWAGGLAEPGVAIQGNILAGPQVVAAMKEAWDGRRRAAARPAAARRAHRGRRRRAATGAAGSRPRCSWCGRAPATAGWTTSPSTCASTTTPRRSRSWPGCSTSASST